MEEEKIIKQYHNLVLKIIWRYAGDTSMPLKDLIHEGYIGLIVAYRKFDPDRGVKFITYATWWVMQKVELALRKDRGRFNDLPLDETIRIEGQEYSTPWEEVNKKITIDKLKASLAALGENERAVITYRYLANSNKTMSFRAIGAEIGFTHSRAEQIDKIALKKLREEMKIF